MVKSKKNEMIIIGGAESKNGNMEILKYVASCVKNTELMLICTIASEFQNEIASDYIKIFKSLGVTSVKHLLINSRNDCSNTKKIDLVKKASLIFFTGGNQLKITSLLGGTVIYKNIKEKINKGCVYVGTSAGASVISETMIYCGESGEAPSKSIVKMSSGFGLIEGVIIDQHFSERGRIGRLLTMIAQNPENIGIGIDEDTAVIIKNNQMRVLGSGAVYIVDGRQISYSSIFDNNEKDTLSIYDIKLHVLSSGKKYSLVKNLPFEEEF